MPDDTQAMLCCGGPLLIQRKWKNPLDEPYLCAYETTHALVVWLEEEGAKPSLHAREPHSSLARRISAWLVGFLPIESQL